MQAETARGPVLQQWKKDKKFIGAFHGIGICFHVASNNRTRDKQMSSSKQHTNATTIDKQEHAMHKITKIMFKLSFGIYLQVRLQTRVRTEREICVACLWSVYYYERCTQQYFD